MSCPNCAEGLSSDIQKCPECGAGNPAFDPMGPTRRDLAPRDATDTAAPVGRSSSDILGFVVLYAASAEKVGPGPEPRHGRVIPLRASDVLFFGKSPLPTEVPVKAGAKSAPSAHHLFPFTEDFAHISRRHLVIEMEPDGRTTLLDLSTNGVFLVGANRHVRRGKGQAFVVETIEGRETVVLGVDLSATGDPRAREKATHYQIQIIPARNGGKGRVS